METLSSIKLRSEKVPDPVQVKTTGEVKLLTEALSVETDKRLELYNLTDKISELVKNSNVRNGVINIASLHTTTALFINEYQSALLEDIKNFLERLVRQSDDHRHHCQKHGRTSYGYKHNCEYCSDCDRKNADAHIGATLLGHNLSLPISNGQLLLGKWQSIIFAELDGPRERTVVTQIIGN